MPDPGVAHTPGSPPIVFSRRRPQPQLLVSTDVMRRLSSNMPAPKGPSLPMSDSAHRVGARPEADLIAAVRDSGTVVGFLSSGASRGSLTARVYDVITSPEGCGLGKSSSIDAFAAQFCDSVEGKRRLVQALAVQRPTVDPTAQLTRSAVTAWVRSVGLAAQTRGEHTPAPPAADAGEWRMPDER
jgi:hypothetical protein